MRYGSLIGLFCVGLLPDGLSLGVRHVFAGGRHGPRCRRRRRQELVFASRGLRFRPSDGQRPQQDRQDERRHRGWRSPPSAQHGDFYRFCYGRRVRRLKSSAWRVPAPIPSIR